jgi:hypothetical protein
VSHVGPLANQFHRASAGCSSKGFVRHGHDGWLRLMRHAGQAELAQSELLCCTWRELVECFCSGLGNCFGWLRMQTSTNNELTVDGQGSVQVERCCWYYTSTEQVLSFQVLLLRYLVLTVVSLVQPGNCAVLMCVDA